jgi:hypothetical protein
MFMLTGAITATVLLGAAAVLIWAPWRTHPPAPPMAVRLPTNCPALAGLPAPDGFGGGTGQGRTRDTDCEWGPGTSSGFPPVRATTILYSSINEAEQQSASQVTVFNGPTHGFSLGADTPIAGVGDDARISDHDGYFVLVARKANVVLTMEYIAPGNSEPDQQQAIIATAARTLLSGITLTTA